MTRPLRPGSRRPRRWAGPTAALLVGLALAGCASSAPTPPASAGSTTDLSSAGAPTAPTSATATATQALVDLADPWRIAPPAAVGIDPDLLAAADTQAHDLGSVRSLVVVRHGVLVDARYLGGTTAATLDDVRSVTKSVTSLLVGIATADGTLGGPGERLDALLRPPVTVPTGPKAAVTVADLLTMRSGFEWDESTTAGYNAWATAPNQVDYLLDRPLAYEPGTRFTYDTAAVHLLSVGLSQAAGESTDAYARRVLFDPLGFGADAWETDDQGFDNGGAGLAMRPIDIAKIGQLVLQHGRSGARQVVPAAWVSEITTDHVPLQTRLPPLGQLDYGELWWLGAIGGDAVELAWGYRGQFIFIVPARDLVVVVTSVLDDPSIDSDAEEIAAMDLIVNWVLPAVR